MRLDGTRLRSRRLQLGMTMRGLAREAGISQTLVKRLEDTGEVDSITCATLQRLVDALSVDLVDMLAEPTVPSGDDHVLEHLGTILLGRKGCISTSALAGLLAIDAAVVEDQLSALGDKLQQVGIRVHRGATGVRLVPADSANGPDTKRQDLKVLSNSDLRLLHRVLYRDSNTRDVAALVNGNISLHRLCGCALVDIGHDGVIRPRAKLNDALLL